MSLTLPNFLIIGAARCGTTTLYKCLQEHPDIYLPESKRPEPHFFLKEEEYRKTIQYYSDRFFRNTYGRTMIGEASTSYLFNELAASRIQYHLPDIKLIVMIRNPVERAFSNYWHTVKSGLETITFSEAIRTENQRCEAITDPALQEIQPFAYIGRSLYYKQLSIYLKYFSRSKILVILLDELRNNPEFTISSVYDFLGVSPGFIPTSIRTIFNQSTPSNTLVPGQDYCFLSKIFLDDIENLERLLEKSLADWKDSMYEALNTMKW